jgi:hypothetical protein
VKKNKIFFIFITLVFSCIPIQSSYSANVIKSGSICKAKNQNIVFKSNSFVCVKSRKKLVWKKINLPTNVEVVLFSAWSTNFDTDLMVKSALQSTDKYFGKVIPNNSYEIFVDKLLSESDRIWITKMLDYSNGAFKSIGNKNVKVFVGTSHEWSKSTLSGMNLWLGDIGGPFPCSDGILDVLCADKNLILLITKNPSQSYWTVGYRSAPAHEFFHTIQYFLTGPQFTGHGGHMTDLSSKRIPRWLIEGSANYFGYYMVNKMGFYSYQDGRRIQVELSYAKDYLQPLSEHDYLANPSLNPYGIGQAATEYIIASVGFESLLNIFKYTNSEGNFSDGFKKATGIEIEDFYYKFEKSRHLMSIGTSL